MRLGGTDQMNCSVPVRIVSRRNTDTGISNMFVVTKQTPWDEFEAQVAIKLMMNRLRYSYRHEELQRDARKCRMARCIKHDAEKTTAEVSRAENGTGEPRCVSGQATEVCAPDSTKINFSL